ncbi:glycosyltransferase involved in cell wall biosynthesis [Murinocardiopsis flavida]|uniref:Glycosyltransferase involved in cell wall biosynthesis n=1 Tax=Murinocardiopsis flavida TaxID=645275 RepID=A0A2P8DIT5_9ACTN|nr:glycosyltransferase family 4 protein [Murinocardiopsis flavida]PSK97069.1 glycosyltransferase involved in cell wall biosynthesis [Murinocardiopsis flavida]
MVAFTAVRNFAKAAVFTATLTVRHLRAEPARVPLLGLRLLPSPARRAVRGAAQRIGGLPRCYALWDAGRRAEMREEVRRLSRGASIASLARLAAFTLAVEQPVLAGELLERIPQGRRRAGLSHRLGVTTGQVVPARAPRRWNAITVAPDRRTRSQAVVNGQRSVPVRVLHVVTNALPHTNAGYTQRTHRIALGQQAAGVEPHVLTRIGYPLTKGVRDARALVVVDGVRYHRLLPWRAPKDDAAGFAASLRMAAEVVRRVRPDVLHAASDHRNGALALALGRMFAIPVVYEVRGFLEESWLSRDPSRSPSDAFYQAERAAETECMLAADAVVTLGEAMRAEIVGRGVAPSAVNVIGNAVDDAFLAPLPDREAPRAALGIGAGDFVVGSTTSCYSYEGLDTLVDAVALLRGRGVPAHLLLVGDGPELGALRERAAALGGAAHLPGRVPAAEVRGYHAALDVFAVPRRDERVCRLVTPLKPVEAMAGGLPVVASDLPALAELVEPGVTGELIPPDDSEALANCLESLFYSRTTSADYGRAAKAGVGADRTWAAAARRYLEIYKQITGELSDSGHIG